MSIIVMVALIAVQTAATSTFQSPPEKPKLVCKSLKVTGSRLAVRRVCGTARQWELAEKEAQEAARESQNQSTGPGGMDEGSAGRSPG
ncbi:hypothetical protein [Sphingomonas sp.]|uniref:hypothetical protein n=1 Tax=Sphingomonas sp. TaxID=28214 RepID=UPI00286A2753|nr:hypothetical protein [Sphingomonas sp.]